MTNGNHPSYSGKASAVISVDAMGSDKGPAAVVAGLVDSGRADPDLAFILHGDQAQLAPLLAKAGDVASRVQVVHAERVVTMNDKPAQVLRHGEGTSMWSTVESVKQGQAKVAVSCGNTGALMALSMIRLRKLPGVNRPAIACFWPSRNPSGFNVMLDVGADIKADAADLVQYATMGAAYASVALNLANPRVGLLNVGTEEHKGRAELKEAHELLTQSTNGFAYAGFVEGSDIPGTACDVIVTDGFTGNVALKTGEGTAKLISDFLRQEYSASLTAKIAAALSMRILRRLQTRMDPRRVNGGVFLGLNGTVVKSHGSADATGVAAAIQLAARLARSGMNERLAERLAPVATEQQGGGT
jgi:phosphate acyltransferase